MSAKRLASSFRADLIRGLLLSSVALIAGASAVRAKGVEQHPAPVLHGPQTDTISAQALATRLNDGAPFGVDLSGLMVVDSHANGAAARAKTGPGINTGLAGSTARSPQFAAVLLKYIGQPLSYRVIGSIEADVTKFYRDHGRSLVLVTVPPQEVTSGVLQINVNTFVLEDTVVEGAAAAAQQGYVASQIRVKPGQEVNTATLLEDVNWLNLNPFRHVSVVFEPGGQADSTRLTLQVQNGRPWSAYAGFANSGTFDTGEDRIFAGFNLSALPWQDHQLSYQFNAAPESISHGDFWNTGTNKGYVTNALSYFVPITTASGLRMKLTLGLDHISSYSVPGGIFTSGENTSGATAELAFPLPRQTGTWTLVPEVYVGAAYNDFSRTQYAFDTAIATEKTKVSHVELGLRSALNGKLFDLSTHGDFAVSVISGQARLNFVTLPFVPDTSKVTYSYVKASIRQELQLPQDRSVALRFGGQYSSDLLPSLEQLSLGGDGTVRGYPTDSVSSQSAASFSIEYRSTPFSLPMGKGTGKLRPHVFADAGVADKTVTTPFAQLASVGLGAELDVGEDLIAKLDVAQALDDAGTTKAGDILWAFQLTARF